jgi:carbonic anhydrase
MRSLSVLALVFVLFSSSAFAQHATHATHQKSAEAPSAQALWRALLASNETFVQGSLNFGGLRIKRESLANGQNPPITIVACSDSRVPPELVFDRSLGDLFIIRTAGNVVDDFGIASIEYAIAHDYTRLIVVLAHEDCGAVRSAMNSADPGSPSLRALVQRIRAAIPAKGGSATDPAVVRRAIEANARASAAYLLAHSKIIHDAVQCHPGPTCHPVGLVTAYYNLVSGRVELLP